MSSEYQEFTGRTVEEALRAAREAFGGASLDDLDFEILTPGSRGVLGMGAEPARIVAAPRSALGGSAPRREAAASVPLPTPERPPREFGDRDRGDRDRGSRDRGGFGRDRGRGRDRGDADRRPSDRPMDRPIARDDEMQTQPPMERPMERPVDRPRPPLRDRAAGPAGRPERGARPVRSGPSTNQVSDSEEEQVRAGRAAHRTERDELQAAEASPEALAAGRDILEQLLRHMGLNAAVTIQSGDTSKLDVTGAEDEKEALGALIGRKGERLSALQHLVNLMLSRKMGEWTRVLVDVEDYRGRRERQLIDLAMRAAERVTETGRMLQLEPMPALERRWIHLALRNHPDVATQSIGEEPQRRIVILRRQS